MRFFLLFILIYSFSECYSQVIFEKYKHDFGDLTSISERFIDILVTNKNSKKEFLLSIKKPPNVVYLTNGQFMEKDSSLTIRLQVNPKNKGRFVYEVQIYTSDKDEPTLIKLTGNLTEEITNQTNSLQACPDFNSTPSKNKATEFELSIITIDKNTRELLDASSVTILQNGLPNGIFITNKKGEIKCKIPLGFTYFYINKSGYSSKEIGAYVNFQRNKIIVELEKNQLQNSANQLDNKPLKTEISANQKNEITIELKSQLENDIKQEATVQKIEENQILDTIQFEDLNPTIFDDAHFKPINVTFVLDVSSSMQAGEKMELLKFSLYQIVDILRKQDKISIVSYASETKVELPTSIGTEKEKIKKIVEGLKAGGLTAGGSGIKLGYIQTLNSYIQNGVNQIVVITDGAFNKNSDDYKNYIEKYKKKGINMTVVGILNNETDKKTMQKVAELGGGRYVEINKLSDAMNNLKQEIRFISFKR